VLAERGEDLSDVRAEFLGCYNAINHAALPFAARVIRNEVIVGQAVVTSQGVLSTRPEAASDKDFLFSLFESVKGPDITRMPVNDVMKSHLLHMQYRGMAQSYRARYASEAFSIVIINGKPAGRLIMDVTDDRIHIVYIALLPQWRGRGIGSAVMRAVLARACVLRLPCEATVAVDNVQSLQLWAALGFIERARDATDVILEWRPSPGDDE
jgi:ribosomal protein S18 acetylase RimI-like enzyme